MFEMEDRISCSYFVNWKLSDSLSTVVYLLLEIK